MERVEVARAFRIFRMLFNKSLRTLEAAGTKTLLIAANPGQVNLVSPAEIGPALKAGYDRAVNEADRVKAFWA
jgi:hypothetical protein